MNRQTFRAAMASLGLIVGGYATGQVPDVQQAIVQEGNGGPEVLSLQTVPLLEPGPGQVLIQVHAASVNPVDWKTRVGYSGRERPLGTPPPDEPPARIPGFDAAGIVAMVGPGVSGLDVGDEVFTMIGRVSVDGLNGAYSQYVIAPADNVIAKPDGLSFAEASGIGTVGLAAARVLNDVAISPGTRVFVNGIAGGVGSSAAQIARARGATVIGTASERHHNYLRSLGVDQIVDYTRVDFTQVVEAVDVYVETVNADLATRGLAIVRPGGSLVSVVGGPANELCGEAGVICPRMGPPPPGPGAPGGQGGPGGQGDPGGPGSPGGVSEGDLLRDVAELAEQGMFRINVDVAYPLAEAADAQEYNREGHTQGKVVLIVIPEE